MSRPSEYTEAIAAIICERLIGDPPESLRAICRDPEMPSKSTVLKWVSQHKEFADQYTRAREMQADCYRDEGDEIAKKITSGEEAQIARVQLDWIKWNAARMAPKKYGDKVQNEVSGPDGGPIQASIAVTFVRGGSETKDL